MPTPTAAQRLISGSDSATETEAGASTKNAKATKTRMDPILKTARKFCTPAPSRSPI
jgi:hypothetical protein